MVCKLLALFLGPMMKREREGLVYIARTCAASPWQLVMESVHVHAMLYMEVIMISEYPDYYGFPQYVHK